MTKGLIAYSLVEVQELAYGDGKRVIRGIATSPSVDRTGDVIEMNGVQVAPDIPLFMYHDSTKAVGRAKFGKPTKDGIPFEATLPNIAEAGALKDRVEEAWQMVQYGLITAVSIGFRTLNDAYELIKGGGIKYNEIEVMELSLVPVPAQPDAVIQGIKSLDQSARDAVIASIKSLDQTQRQAALGSKQHRVVRVEKAVEKTESPGASGTLVGVHKGVVFLK